MGELKIPIQNEYDIVSARQAVRQLSRELGFGTVDQVRIATAVSELVRNVVLYAGQGFMIVQTLENNGDVGIEVIVEDQGPGIVEQELAMTDGYSTSGGLGAGLPGARRLMDFFDVNTIRGKGTRILTRKWLR
jgi:serine/threonine-protein kinase RsbT